MDPKDQVDAGNGVKANASSTTETPTFGDTDSRGEIWHAQTLNTQLTP